MAFRFINQDGRDVTEDTLAKLMETMGVDPATGERGGLEKADTVTLSNGLVAYDLESPSKNLYPVLTPLRNRIPREVRGGGAGDAAHWKEVSSIKGGGVPSMGWVPEGQRAPLMSIVSAPKSATYVTIGEEADVTFEATSAAEGFEDIMATTGLRMLQSAMIKEEYAILGGNKTVALGTPSAPTVVPLTTGGTIPDATYNVGVVALTLEGVLAATVSVTGVLQAVSVQPAGGGAPFTVNGGSSMVSAFTGTGAISGSNQNVITASVTAVKGAMAYAWYVGTAGNERIQAITYVNSLRLTALVNTTTYQISTAVTADCSLNATLAFDGLIYTALASSTAYLKTMATGATLGTGTGLSADSNGGIVEIDEMLKSMWDNYRLSIEELYVNAQELKNITTKTLTGSGTPLVRFNLDQNQQSIMAGAVVGTYFNKYAMNGGVIIPIKLHPNLPAGTMFGWAQNLPAHYQSANVPQTAGIQCRRDYYQIPWPLIERKNTTGVYAEEVLKVYAPFAMGVITNIGNA